MGERRLCYRNTKSSARTTLLSRWKPSSRSAPLWSPCGSPGCSPRAGGGGASRSSRSGAPAWPPTRSAAAAIAWGAAGGWNEGVFRAYYLFGGLLTAALLGAGSLAGAGVRAAIPAALLYTGLAAGVALAVPLEAPLSGTSIPEAQEHLALFPARILAIAGNVAGSLALVGVAVAGFRRRPLGNALLLAGFALAAAGSAVAGLGAAQTAAFVAVAACLLYAGSVARP